jgi:protein-disulfide isomerase
MRRRERVRRWSLQGGIGLGIVAVATAITLMVVQNAQPAGPGPRNMASGGVLLTADGVATTGRTTAEQLKPTAERKDGVAQIVLYEDLQCPACKQFEAANSEYLENAVSSGAATLEIHPVSILDRMSIGNKYSTRAANALACVADRAPDSFLRANSALFAQQPAEGTKGRTDNELIGALRDGGVKNKAVERCIADRTHVDWVEAVAKVATTNKVPNSSLDRLSSTPTILVNGEHYRGGISSSDEFQKFVKDVSR